MANNVQNVRFLRNGSLYESRTAALAGLNSQTLTTEQDGSLILARYGSGNNVETLVGIVYAKGDNKSLTIIDIEDILGTGVSSANTVSDQLAALSGDSESSSADTSVEGAKKYADQKISDAVSSLDYTDTAVAGEYVSQVSEADGVIAVTRVALPDASSVADDNKVVTDITQSKGAITATASNITGVKLAGYVEGSDADIAATDTLGQALGKLQAQINAMDLTVVSGDGEVITAVSEDDGKVSASKTAIKDVKLTGYAKDASKTGVIAATDDIEDALSKIENNIEAAQSATTLSAADKSINVVNAATGTTVALNIRSGEKVLKLDSDSTSGGVYTNLNVVKLTEGLPATVKERYELRDSDNIKIGESIDIAKDSHIVSITYISDPDNPKYQNLKYVYIDASGVTQTEYVDVSALVLEAEFASGVTVTNHIAHGVVDPTSESFLTVGAGGFKITGVSGLVENAIDALDAEVTGGTTAGTATSNHIQVVVGEADGKLTAVTVTETNIADKSALEDIESRYVSGVSVNGNAVTVANHVAPISISATAGTGSSDAALAVNTDANGAVTISLLWLDCGEY